MFVCVCMCVCVCACVGVGVWLGGVVRFHVKGPSSAFYVLQQRGVVILKGCGSCVSTPGEYLVL